MWGMSVLNSFSTDARAAGAIGLTRIIQGHVHCQLVTHSAIQTVGAHGNYLHHVTSVGHQVLNDRPLVVKNNNKLNASHLIVRTCDVIKLLEGKTWKGDL